MKINKKYIEPPRHPFDLQRQRQAVQAINALRNGSIVVGSSNAGTVHNSDGNTVWEIPQSTSISTFVVVSDFGDGYNCNTWDGKTAGSEIIKVAKHQDLRCILPTATPNGGAWATKKKRGITYAYTYSAQAATTSDGVDVVEYWRNVSGDDASSVVSKVAPFLAVGDIISAFQTSFKGPATLLKVEWQALADGRAWTDKAP